jgi:hypothetical protein
MPSRRVRSQRLIIQAPSPSTASLMRYQKLLQDSLILGAPPDGRPRAGPDRFSITALMMGFGSTWLLVRCLS